MTFLFFISLSSFSSRYIVVFGLNACYHLFFCTIEEKVTGGRFKVAKQQTQIKLILLWPSIGKVLSHLPFYFSVPYSLLKCDMSHTFCSM